MQDLFRHLRVHCRKKMDRQKVEICYIHKVAMSRKVHEEPIPFYGIKRWVVYTCPMCNGTVEKDE